MSNRKLSIVILAAGKGTRMSSTLPKVLHTIAGKHIVQYVIDAAVCLGKARIHLIYGYGGELLYKYIFNQEGISLNWVLQKEQRGTGHAVQQMLPDLRDDENILILYGDVPLISPSTLQRLLLSHTDGEITLLTAIHDIPNGYGRIIRNKGFVSEIVEHIDANNKQREIKEINTGILVVGGSDLKRWLTQLTTNNLQKELYLTDIIKIAWNEGCHINTVQPTRLSEIEGVNNLLQLAKLERIYQHEQVEKLLLAGVMLMDPSRFDLRGELCHGQDIFIDINVILEGRIILGNRVTIGAGCILKNILVGDDVIIGPYTMIEDAQLCAHSTVGPFSRLRPGSKLEEGSYVGNFVEIKKTIIGKNSKVGHLSYLGDADIGSQVNIGAGTITCNYDGINKHKTIICDKVFVGSDSQLVAPVTIGTGATIGAGTTVTCDVDAGKVIISRIRQFPITNRTRPIKKE